MALEYIAIWGFTALVAAALAGIIASVKNRHHSFWMAWCFVLPPMLLILVLLPKRVGPRPVSEPLGADDHIDH